MLPWRERRPRALALALVPTRRSSALPSATSMALHVTRPAARSSMSFWRAATFSAARTVGRNISGGPHSCSDAAMNADGGQPDLIVRASSSPKSPDCFLPRTLVRQLEEVLRPISHRLKTRRPNLARPPIARRTQKNRFRASAKRSLQCFRSKRHQRPIGSNIPAFEHLLQWVLIE